MPRIRIDSRELSGAFGDVGTDLPLLIGMLLATDLNPASVLVVFGMMQIFTACMYGLPMPVQPLKAVAALVIAGGLSAAQIYGAGLSIGIAMLLLTVSGLLERLQAAIPKAVVRGIQLGLGLKLAHLALFNYMPSDGMTGILLSVFCLVVIALVIKSRRCPPAVPVIAIGLIYAFAVNSGAAAFSGALGFELPRLARFSAADVLSGMIILALPQLPLSIGNSLLATRKVAEDLFPETPVSLKKIGLSYSLMNIASSFLGGVPVCHGSGGMAGHHAFGARTGGSVLIYGTALIVLGLFFSNGFDKILHVFPLPVLGAVLFVESLALIRLVKDAVVVPTDLTAMLVTALAALLLPYGFLIGMVAGWVVWRILKIREARPAGALMGVTDD